MVVENIDFTTDSISRRGTSLAQ